MLVVLFEWEEEQNWKAVEMAVSNRTDRIKHNTRHRPVQILCVRVQRDIQKLDSREELERAVRRGGRLRRWPRGVHLPPRFPAAPRRCRCR